MVRMKTVCASLFVGNEVQLRPERIEDGLQTSVSFRKQMFCGF